MMDNSKEILKEKKIQMAKKIKAVDVEVPKIIHEILPIEFKGRASQKEFQFKQLKREGMIALYEKKDKEGTVYYETIVVQKHDGRTMPGGAKVPPSEYFPSDNSFGLYGWCFNLLDKAEEKYQSLLIKK